jgi:hypothetical protein
MRNALARYVSISGSFLLTTPHCSSRAHAPAVTEAAALVPFIVPWPVGKVPVTSAPGAVKSGDISGSRVGPQPEAAYRLLLSALDAPQVMTPTAVAGTTTVDSGVGVRNRTPGLTKPVVLSHAL